MDLDVNGTTIADPTADDVARALGGTTYADGWYITLEAADGAMLDAVAGDDSFILTHEDGGVTRKAEAAAAVAKTAFVGFFKGEPGWDSGVPFADAAKPGVRRVLGSLFGDPSSAGTTAGGGLPRWAIAAMGAVVVLVVGVFALTRPFGLGPSPFALPGPVYVGLIILLPTALVTVAIVSKLIEYRSAQSWAETTGTIVSSRIAVERHRFTADEETVRNVPRVEYAFSVDGRQFRGSRIGIGDDAGGANTEATLGRYPAGATVRIYYDAADPRRSVLERSGPATRSRTAGSRMSASLGGSVLLIALAGAIWWLVARGPALIAERFPRADPGRVVLAGSIGLGLLLFFQAWRRFSKQSASWPAVRGEIVRSDVEEFHEKDDDQNSRTSYRPAVEYAYTVRGRDYRGTRISLGLTVSGERALAEKTAGRYPAGSHVDIHYDPDNPGEAALENPTGASWLLLLAALAALAVAVGQLQAF